MDALTRQENERLTFLQGKPELQRTAAEKDELALLLKQQADGRAKQEEERLNPPPAKGTGAGAGPMQPTSKKSNW